MKITRNGVDFELTREELFEAHNEYQWLVDVEKVREDMPIGDIFNALPEDFKVAFCETVATDAAHYYDNYGYKWGDAVDNAFEDNKDQLAPMYARAMLGEKDPFCSMSEDDANSAFEEIGDDIDYLTNVEGMALTEAFQNALNGWMTIYREE